MNNIQKFEETKKALAIFQKELIRLEEVAEKKLESEGLESKEYFKAFLTALRTKELSIDKKGRFMRFESTTFGDYIQSVRNDKRSMNVIPLCFLLHLYTEDLEVKQITDEKQTDIPFTLRGFWKMNRAEKFVNDLTSMQIDFASMIQKQIDENSTKDTRVKKLEKILEVVESLEILVVTKKKKQFYEIRFEGNVFKVKKENRKLDMVPLCKMITSYYVRVINYIEDYKKLLRKTEDKQEIDEMEISFMKLMQKNFTLYVVR